MTQSGDDTIFAPASGAGRAAVTLLRLSGPLAGPILDTLCRRRPAPRFAALRSLRDAAGEVLDRAIVLWLPGPASYTGEDCAELHLHGGPAPVRRFLPELISLIWNREIDPGVVFDLTLPLEQAAEGYAAMDQRTATKVLLTV